MAVFNVADATQLASALLAAKAGDTISLAAGDYGTLALNGALTSQAFAKFDGPVTIKSADVDHPATFTSVNLSNVSNLAFEGVKFDLVTSSAGNFTPFKVDNSSNIAFRNASFDGALVEGLGEKQGLLVTDSKNITVEGSEFFNFWYGAGFHDVENLTFRGNNLHDMAYDATRFSNIAVGLIEDNRYSAMKNPQAAHRDMIQFWTEGDSTPSHDITIRGNVITSDDAPAMVQAIFLYNEAVTRHGAGKAMYYSNVVIEDNYILGNHPNAIVVGPATGVSVKNNIVVQDTGNVASRPGWNPEINVDPASTGVTISGNTANEITNVKAGWVVSCNTIVPVGTIPPVPAWPASGGGSDGGTGSGNGTGSGTDPVIPPVEETPQKATHGDDELVGTAALDLLNGMKGNDHISGLGGADRLIGGTGKDVLIGGEGADRLFGGADSDILIGGQGADTFIFRSASNSDPWARDVIRGGDGARAFEGVGAGVGDVIDLSQIDANSLAAGDQAFVLRGSGVGSLTFSEWHTATLVQGNTDKDAAFEFVIVIEDGITRASQYTAADFVL